MKVLDAWPDPGPKKKSKLEAVQPYLDGRIYQFDVDDCRDLFGMPIEAQRYSKDTTDDDLAHHTKFLQGRAIIDLDTMLRSGCRRTHGPYQARGKIVDNTVIFQWTGPQPCRLKVCDLTAVDGGKGYCQNHYNTKKKEGKV